jgi:hypothetical protein
MIGKVSFKTEYPKDWDYLTNADHASNLVAGTAALLLTSMAFF